MVAAATWRILECFHFLFSFRQKSGIWGFRSERTEKVNGIEAKVFTASGVEMVTRTRVEHLPPHLKKKAAG